MNKKIKLLGISGSPRRGNSDYLLNKALEDRDDIDFALETTIYSLAGKKIQPCIGCFKCGENKGQCILKDDFEDLRQLWINSDVVIYSFPVYHLSIPGQLKCFIDRLGNAFYGYYEVSSMRHMKVIGALCQGMHYFGGQELAVSFILQHSVLLNSIPIAGDGWHSYIGAEGWTNNNTNRNALEQLCNSGDMDAGITLTAAKSVIKRAVEVAAIIKAGVSTHEDKLKKDIRYIPYLERMHADDIK
jgi:multimeric flavodoxin WrbA